MDDYLLAVEHPSSIQDEIALLQSLLARILSESPVNIEAMQSCLDSISKLRKVAAQIDAGHRGYDSPESYAEAVYRATQKMIQLTAPPNPADDEEGDDE